MKKVLKKLIVLCLCLFMMTGCDLKEIIKELLAASSSSSSQQIGGENNEGCAVYSTLDVVIEEEGVSLLSDKSELEKVFEKVDESTFMATACYVVAGTRYERLASGFIIKKEVLEDAYKYYLVSSASKLFYRGSDSGNAVVNRSPEYVEVVFGNYQRYYAKVEGYYERLDIVILSIQTKDELTPLTLGDSDNLILGDDVYSMGTPEIGVSLLNTMIKGHMSKLNVSSNLYYNNEQIATYITHQFDAPTNYGMEGGPVFLANGDVVGILTYKFAAADEYESLSRFIPINNVKNCLEALTSNKEYAIPTVGIQVIDLYNAVALYGVTWTDSMELYEGCYIDQVVAGGVADKANILSDSVIVGAYLNDEYYKIKGSNYISIVLSRYKEGDTLKFEVQYQNEKKVHVIFGD